MSHGVGDKLEVVTVCEKNKRKKWKTKGDEKRDVNLREIEFLTLRLRLKA
jgi:hypothetical protein